MVAFENLLKTESDFYEREQHNLLVKYPNRVLLIHGDHVEGDFDSGNAAISEGVRKFGTGPFLARRAGEEEPVFFSASINVESVKCR